MTVEAWVLRCALDEHGGWSEGELARAAAMRSAAAGTRYLAGRAALRRVLADRVGVPPVQVALADDPAGPPSVVDRPDLRISLSYAADVIVLAVAEEAPVGIDVEIAHIRRRPVPQGAADQGKLAATAAVVGDRLAPVAAWVALEAALKLDGTGLTVPLATVTLAPAPGGVLVDTPAGRRGVRLQVVDETTVVGVAGVDRPPEVRWHLGWQTEPAIELSSGGRRTSGGRSATPATPAS